MKIRREQYKKLKEYDIKLIDCWELGFIKTMENYGEELEKRKEKVYTEYILLEQQLKAYGKKLDTEQKEIERLLEWYKKRGTSIDDPSTTDLETVRFQMRKRNIISFTVEQVFKYWQELKK